MVSRLWFGSSTFDKADDYVNHLRNTVFPKLHEIEGFQGTYILRRNLNAGVEFAIMTMWESWEAIRKFAGENTEIAVVPPEAQALLSKFDSNVRHYEVVVGPDI